MSVANAEANLQSEIGSRTLEQVPATGAGGLEHRTESTCRFPAAAKKTGKCFTRRSIMRLLHPSVFNDVNGEYMGFDDKVHSVSGHTQYTNFSGWDIYRSQVQLLAMLFPAEASDMAQSLVRDAQQGGGLPRWATANGDTGSMVGDPSACMLASFYAFGARKFDTKAALSAMLRGANDPAVHSRQYFRAAGSGGVPCASDTSRAAAARGAVRHRSTLEYQNADFAISQFAAALGDHGSVAEFSRTLGAVAQVVRSPRRRYIRPRNEQGEFPPASLPAMRTASSKEMRRSIRGWCLTIYQG